MYLGDQVSRTRKSADLGGREEGREGGSQQRETLALFLVCSKGEVVLLIMEPGNPGRE